MIKFLALAALVLVVMGVTGASLTDVANIFIPAEVVTVNGETCQVREGVGVIPQMGYYECKAMQTARRTFMDGRLPSGTGLPYCGQNEYTPQCEYIIRCPAGDKWFFGLDFTITRLRYIIDKGSQAGEHTIKNLECSAGQPVEIITLNRGERITYIAWETWDILHGWHIPKGSTIKVDMKLSLIHI